MIDRKKSTIILQYVVNSQSRCSHVDSDGVIQQYIPHSVLCIRHTGPGFVWCASGNNDVIKRTV